MYQAFSPNIIKEAGYMGSTELGQSGRMHIAILYLSLEIWSDLAILLKFAFFLLSGTAVMQMLEPNK